MRLTLTVIAWIMLSFVATGCASTPRAIALERAEVETAVTRVLDRQMNAWNAGNIDAFMMGYWESPELRFASGGSVTRGWEETRNGYYERYGEQGRMGQLSFTALEVEPLGTAAAIVHGAWALQRAGDRPSGLFTLVFRRIGGAWKIVSDTTTSAG